MKRLLTLVPLALILTACTPAEAPVPTPAPTVTVTVTPEPVSDDWTRFREDPKQAFIFASAYEIIWGGPIGNGESADTMVEVAASSCRLFERTESWDKVTDLLGGDESAEKIVAMSQIYCPELTD